MRINPEKPTVCIVCPSRILGGTELVYFWIAKNLIKKELNVIIVDHKDGWTKSPYIKLGYEITPIEPNKLSDIVTNVDLFLCSAKFINYTIRLGRNCGYDISGRVVSWLLHPRELTSNLYRVPRRIFKILKINEKLSNSVLDSLYRHSSIYEINSKLLFDKKLHPMDEATAHSITSLHSIGIPEIFPVPIPEDITNAENSICYSPISSGLKRIIWISRMEGFKVPPLLQLISSIEVYSREECSKRIELILIGDGEKLNEIKHVVGRLNNKVSVDVRGAVSHDSLKIILSTEHFDYAFGMGASLLECVANGIPAIVGLAAESKDEYGSSNKIFRLLGSKNSLSLGEYTESRLGGITYYDAIHFLNRSTLLSRISMAQRRWYLGKYKYALEKYVSHVNQELSKPGLIKNCTAYVKFKSIVKSWIYEELFKNSKFPT